MSLYAFHHNAYLVNLLNFTDQPCLEGSRLWTLSDWQKKEEKIEANADRKYEWLQVSPDKEAIPQKWGRWLEITVLWASFPSSFWCGFSWIPAKKKQNLYGYNISLTMVSLNISLTPDKQKNPAWNMHRTYSICFYFLE